MRREAAGSSCGRNNSKFLPVNGQGNTRAEPVGSAGLALCMFSDTWRLLKVAFAGWWNDRAMSLGASIAFFTVFSLAPMLLAAIAVAGLAFGREAAQGAIVAELGGMIGTNEASFLETMIASAGNVGSGIIGTSVGIVTFLLLVTGAVVELQDDLNIIWKAKPPASYGVLDFIRTRLVSFALVLGIGFLLLVSLVIDTGLTAIGSYLEATFSGSTVILRFLNSLVSFAVATLLFAMMFKLLPAVDIQWSDVWTGSLVTALLFTVGKFLIGYYLGKSNVASSYGAAASIITILLWIYYSSLILLFGAEFTKAYAESRGSRSGDNTAHP
jgi:membrane protein